MRRVWMALVGSLLAVTQVATAPAPASSDVTYDHESRVIEIRLQSGSRIRRTGGSRNPYAGCMFARQDTAYEGAAWIEGHLGAHGLTNGIVNVANLNDQLTNGTFLTTGVCLPGAVQNASLVGRFFWWISTPPGTSTEVPQALLDEALRLIPIPDYQIVTAPDGQTTPFLTNLPVGLRPSVVPAPLVGLAQIPIQSVEVQVTPLRVDFRGGGKAMQCTVRPTDDDLLTLKDPGCSLTFEQPTPVGTPEDLQMVVTYSSFTVCLPVSCAGDPAMQVGNITVNVDIPIRVVEARSVLN